MVLGPRGATASGASKHPALTFLPRWRLIRLPSVLQEISQLIENEVKVQGEDNSGDEAEDLAGRKRHSDAVAQKKRHRPQRESESDVTPAALEELPAYFDTAIMETMK